MRNGVVGVKVLRGQWICSLQMCDYLWLWYITHRRKIFLCIYSLIFNSVLTVSGFWQKKHKFLKKNKKKNHPNTIKLFPKHLRFLIFFPEKALQQWKTTKEFLPFFFFKVRKRPSWNPLQKHGVCPFQVRQEDHQKCPGCIKKSSNAGATRSLPLFLWWPHGTFVPWNPPAFVTNLLSQAAGDYFQYFMNRGSLCSASLSSCGWCFCLPDEFPPFLM